jgi:hypothetical protein
MSIRLRQAPPNVAPSETYHTVQLSMSVYGDDSNYSAMLAWKTVVDHPTAPKDYAHARKLYKSSALRHHPDKGGSPANFRALNESFEQLQIANVTGSITTILHMWKLLWNCREPSVPSPSPFQPSPPPKPKTREELKAELADHDLNATEDQLTGKASQVIVELVAAFGDTTSRAYQFFVWRMKTNAHPTMSHDAQAVVMQNLCATFDAALVLLRLVHSHPCLRCVSFANLMAFKNWQNQMDCMPRDMLDSHGNYPVKLWDHKKIQEKAIQALFCIVQLYCQNDIEKTGLKLFELLRDRERVYQIRQLPRFEVYLRSKQESNRPSFFSDEELQRFAVEREELRDPTIDLPAGEEQENMAEVLSCVATLEEEMEQLRNATQEDAVRKMDEIKKLKNAIKEGTAREKREIEKLQNKMNRVQADLSQEKASAGACVPSVGNKRSHTAMLGTPMLHVRGLSVMLGSLFQFLENLEKVDGLFQVCDALRHAYMREAADAGEELDYTDADHMAHGRMKTLRPLFVAAGVKQAKFGRVSSFALSYPELADLLLQDKKLRWFRQLHITITSDALLPSPEVHIALAAHLEAIRSRIDVSTVAAVLGVTLVTAKRIAPQLQQGASVGVLKVVQCLKMIKGARKLDAHRQCKKTAKINQRQTGTGEKGVTDALCCYHKASIHAQKPSQ